MVHHESLLHRLASPCLQFEADSAFQQPLITVILHNYSHSTQIMKQMNANTSQKYLSIFPFCAIVAHPFVHCGNSNTNVTNYTITTTGYELCTVHLKSFTNNPAELEKLHQIVDANQESNVLWTIWDYNASTSINPSIYFYESCSINVVLDFLPDHNSILIQNYVLFNNTYS
jgi:hypothetical protein